MNEYPYHGGDGYTMLKNKTGTITSVLDIDNVIAYIVRKGPIYLERESRIVFEGEQQADDTSQGVQNHASMIGVVKSTTLIVTVANLIIFFVQ